MSIRLPDGSIHNENFDGVNSFIDVQQQDHPSIYLLWTAEHLNLLSLGFVSRELHALSRRFEYFTDDSVGGLVMRSCIARLGLTNLPVSEDPVQRLKLLRAVLKQRSAAFLVVDGRGPYFSVSTGIISLARAINARLFPCTVAASPRVLLPNISVPISLPVPRGRLLLYVGAPIEPDQFAKSARDNALSLSTILSEIRDNAYTLCRNLGPVAA